MAHANDWPDSGFRRRRTYPSTYRDLDSPNYEETPTPSNQRPVYPQRAPFGSSSASRGDFVNAQVEEDTWVIKPCREEGEKDGMSDLKRGSSDGMLRNERGEFATRAADHYRQDAPYRGRSLYGNRQSGGEYARDGTDDKREYEQERWRRGSTVDRVGKKYVKSGFKKKVKVNEPRLFVAILVDDATRLHLCGLPIAHIPKKRCADDKGFHLTLNFIGNANYERVHHALQSVEADAFDMQVKGVGAFPSDTRPLTIWAGVDANRELERLQYMVSEALCANGFKVDSRRYVPHISLAWVLNSDAGIEAGMEFLEMNKEFEANRFRVGEFVLMENVRFGGKESGTHGAYVVRERYGLRERGELG